MTFLMIELLQAPRDRHLSLSFSLLHGHYGITF